MVPTVGITKAITSLTDIRDKFNLRQSDDPQFFTEWYENLPELTESEKESLDGLKNRFFYYFEEGGLTEGTVNIIMLSPLLELLKLCDPPFRIWAEKAVEVKLEGEKDEDMNLEGFIDALVVKNQLWLVVIEAKRYGFNASLVIPQTLAYMMANPNQRIPVFGMVTNGEDYTFIKLSQQGMPQYSQSRKFTLSNPRKNGLYDVMKVMKRITGLLERE